MDKLTKTSTKVEKSEKKLYTVGEVASILRFSPSSIYKFVKTGRIRAVRFGTGRFRIPSKEVQKIMV